MKIKGIKRGQTIELLENINHVADGEEIVVEIYPSYFHPLANLSIEERQNRIKQVLGAWQNNPEIDIIFAEIDRARHSDRGRRVSFRRALTRRNGPVPQW